MTYNFDEEINRFDTHCTKWEYEFIDERAFQTDRAHPKHGDDQLLPLWVADMDFRSPPAVIEALQERAAHGIYGYSAPADCYYEAFQAWTAKHYGRLIEREWVVITPGVVAAIDTMVQAFTAPGDKIIVQPPVYYPFFNSIENNDRVVANNPLKLTGTRYEMDFDDLAEKAADPAATMAILCSPHNPVGRVWTPQELARFGQICRANDVLVIADEIHADLIFDGIEFTSYACISEDFANSSIVCTAPSKTFNLAGLKLSNIIVQNEEMRVALVQMLKRNGLSGTNAFGIVAADAAYRDGEAWLQEAMAYIQQNYRFLQAYVAENIPQLRVMPLEGTYLAWIDFGALGLDLAQREALLLDEAKVWLNEGAIFGAGGEGFQRINLACPRSILERALRRIKTAVEALSTLEPA